MRQMKKLTILLLFFVVYFWTIPRIEAADEIKPSIQVNHIANNVEKLQEKITLFFKFDKKDKTKYMEFLSEVRLAELYYGIKSNQLDLLEPSASRYSTYIGNLTNFAMANRVSSEKDELTKMFEQHIKIIEELQSSIPHDSGWWLALQHDINSAKLFKDKIKSL